MTTHTHHACPVDATPCWRERGCEHVKDGAICVTGDDGVSACVQDVVIKPVPFVEFTPDVLEKLDMLWAKKE